MATITGNAGSDTLLGTPLDDVIDTGGGVDWIDAGPGDDIVRISGPIVSGNPTGSVIEGNVGHDILDLTSWQGHLSGSFEGGHLSLVDRQATPGSFARIADIVGFEEIHLGTGVNDIGIFVASNADPALLQHWTIIGSGGPDNISTSRGYDDIQSGDGNDLVIFKGGPDHISLGSGDDQFVIDADTGYHDHILLDGGAGNDLLDVMRDLLGPHTTIDLEAGTGQVGTTSIAMTQVESFSIQGDAVPALPGWTLAVAGSQGANHLSAGGGGDAILVGRGGDDLIDAYTLTGTLTVYGGSGNDTVIGTAGADWLSGGLYAGDPIADPSLDGGVDFINGGDGNDHIWGNSQFAIQGALDGGDVIHGGAGMDYVNGNGGDDYVAGEDGPDRLYGGAGNDQLQGGNGDDHLNGNKGDDLLFGGDDNDVILGGQGNDFIDGGNGIDTLSGNVGNDTFAVAGSSGFSFDLTGPRAGLTDVITDFQDGADKLLLPLSHSAILHPGGAADFAAAVSLARSVFSPIGGGEVAAIQVGADTYLFFDNKGNGPESAVRLLDISANAINSDDIA